MEAKLFYSSTNACQCMGVHLLNNSLRLVHIMHLFLGGKRSSYLFIICIYGLYRTTSQHRVNPLYSGHLKFMGTCML